MATMAGFGLLGCVFLALLSAFYLKQIPGKEQLATLTDDLQQEFGPLLDPDGPIEAKLVPPARKGETMSLRVRCTFRKDLPRKERNLHKRVLRTIGERTLRHPQWAGKVQFVRVQHMGIPEVSATVRPEDMREAPQGLRRAPESAQRARAKG